MPTAWTLTAGRPTPITGTTGSAAVTNAPSTPAPTPCPSPVARPATPPGPGPAPAAPSTGATVILAPVRSATCTINNNDQAAHLTLVKTVTNDNGGTARRPPGR